jgi:hypothetical protein
VLPTTRKPLNLQQTQPIGVPTGLLLNPPFLCPATVLQLLQLYRQEGQVQPLAYAGQHSRADGQPRQQRWVARWVAGWGE